MFQKSPIALRIVLLVAAVATLMSLACYKENPVSEDLISDYEPPIILEVNPENGSGGVDRNSQVIIRFSSGMDTASVSGSFHVAGGTGMRQWMDSLSQKNGGGNMVGCDDSCMMNWLDSISYGGEFFWNSQLDSCVFQPDSSFMPNADHVILLTGFVCGKTGTQMVLDTMEYGGFVTYFQTGP